ncbi:hypothetical protein [Flexivirga oryzae]|uniref:Lipoprotein n=1 Tax=Flexivirga oryzae TaxID=1794944 RepID=A0A839N355_9MICO|nr:hypothetical protein [Flexivirga oryzae]MBB2892160.1 hypothetical protein [Flexivirga oryzae]
MGRFTAAARRYGQPGAASCTAVAAIMLISGCGSPPETACAPEWATTGKVTILITDHSDALGWLTAHVCIHHGCRSAPVKSSGGAHISGAEITDTPPLSATVYVTDSAGKVVIPRHTVTLKPSEHTTPLDSCSELEIYRATASVPSG